MTRMTPLVGFVGLLLALPLGLAPPAAGEDCDPYPIGRCGDFQRESVVFCYLVVGGQYVSATDTHVLALLAPPPGVANNVASDESGAMGLLYLRKAPAEAVAADPYEAPLPFGTVYQEANNVAGLQPRAFKCANFVWFAECEPPQWMGPFQVEPRAPDAVVA